MSATLGISYKRSAIRAAKELCYNKEVIEKLKKATSDNEITRIMLSARNDIYDEKGEVR